jgi:uncharacterized protein YneF (UPF0154 family)
MTNTIKTSIMLILIMLAVLAGFAIGHHTAQTMWEQATINTLK